MLAFTLTNGVYVGAWVSTSCAVTTGTVPGEWFFNEGSGTASANQGTGPVMNIANGTWTAQAGLSGGALVFNGSTNSSTHTTASASGTALSLASGHPMGACGYYAPMSTALYSRVVESKASTGSSNGVSGMGVRASEG